MHTVSRDFIALTEAPIGQSASLVMSKDFEFALMMAACCCEESPESALPLVAFRQIYSEFLSSDLHERLHEFHDAVSVPIPRIDGIETTQRLLAPCIDVDIIIPVHNGVHHLKACLESVRLGSLGRRGNIIIVDDASDATTTHFVKSFCNDVPQSVLVRTDESVGFTEAISLGVAKSSSPYFVALNSDTIVLDGWLEKLFVALNSAPNVALVGPVSNSAAWQNVADPVDEGGNFIGHPMPDHHDRADMQVAATSASCGAPETPLVHGFCALLDRKAYDHVGQLDVVSFPRGYGEFQDLCVRLYDAGYRSKIANDCFVAHVGGASLSSTQRSDLSKLARRKLYDKHTALRYLTFEAASIYSIPMASWRARCKLRQLQAD